ncbi:YeeE/YedE family protein [Roseomonas sp. 18066]|uniref:YeeE/YedE family protein n=1 Tax=Roseomonas sp. 18066 TaxID=2681412 RepID=UPI00190F7527|nr:YeeE/YedE family protein [Roseomonas sp. 18066]
MRADAFGGWSPRLLGLTAGLAGLVAIWWFLVRGGTGPLMALILGGLVGLAMQRGRFCLLCLTRDFVHGGDPRGLLAVLAALATGLLGYLVVLTNWLPNPAVPGLPPDAHVGPVSWVLVVAGLSFGLGMVLSGACIAGHLYRLGEGSSRAPVSLLGAAIGFGLGFLSWPSLYETTLRDAPVVWLPHHLGYAGSAALALAVLGVAAWPLLRRLPARPARAAAPDAASLLRAIFVTRWPAWSGGVLVGLLGAVAYLRDEPLGVTAALGGGARGLGTAQGWLPARIGGLDGFAGCATAPDAVGGNLVFVLGLVAASLAAAGLAGQFSIARSSARQQAQSLLGGVLMGWGAMTALGCTIGVLLSGIMAGALSGWVFGAAVLAAVWGGLWLTRPKAV